MESLPISGHAEAGADRAVPPATLDGWFTLHQLFRIDWTATGALEPEYAERRASELEATLEPDGPDSPGWSAAYRMVGAGVDLMFLHLRPTLDELSRAGGSVSRSALAETLVLDHEYLSVVELGLYGLTVEVAGRVDAADTAAWETAIREALSSEREKVHVRRRLEPEQPDEMPWVCYYPMDRRRHPDRNWYALPLEARAAMMRAHGSIGRRFAGRISQIIGGSTGLADHEWAVTLFASDPLAFKEIITAMRYDEASAEYAEFGRFFVGRRMSPGDLAALVAREA